MTYETICIEMPCEQAAELYRFCSEHRVTLDELVDQFLRWCIWEPEAFMEWYEKCKKEELSPMNRTPGMPEITQAELIAHIEDENFLRVYTGLSRLLVYWKGVPSVVCTRSASK